MSSVAVWVFANRLPRLRRIGERVGLRSAVAGGVLWSLAVTKQDPNTITTIAATLLGLALMLVCQLFGWDFGELMEWLWEVVEGADDVSR